MAKLSHRKLSGGNLTELQRVLVGNLYDNLWKKKPLTTFVAVQLLEEGHASLLESAKMVLDDGLGTLEEIMSECNELEKYL